MPARAQIRVDDRTSGAPDLITTKNLQSAIKAEIARLINEAAELGGEGKYRNALKRESKAQALLDVLEFIAEGTWPHSGEKTSEGVSPSEELVERYEDLCADL